MTKIFKFVCFFEFVLFFWVKFEISPPISVKTSKSKKNYEKMYFSKYSEVICHFIANLTEKQL